MTNNDRQADEDERTIERIEAQMFERYQQGLADYLEGELQMTCDELRGHVADVLALPLSDSQTIRALLSRVNGADPEQLLAAALAVARQQVSQKIVDLEESGISRAKSIKQLNHRRLT
jgi:hypothetical protein